MSQTELQKQRSTTLKERPQEPRKYNVIVLNDDFTTFEFVITVMMTVFQKTSQQAEEIATTTHFHQKAKVGTYTLDIARSKVAKATEMARSENFPLTFEIEPE
ncbi:MAG: ATP-dependent Clp protease adaptor ClpS [Bacteroidales bacterium]|nr:ATP-dependent Clp protease adaptor ClpS [Bacteroidales bacterium]